MYKKSGYFTIILGCCVVLTGLILLAYMGFYNRYWGDDWCYNRDFKELGLLKTVGTYFCTGEEAARGYSTNRYSLTLFSGLLYLPGLLGTQILATLTICLWLGSLFWVLSNLSRPAPIPKIILFLAAAFLLYYNLYLSPQRFQTLYWQAGVHYSATAIFGLYILGLITLQMAREKPSRAAMYAAAPLAFLAGGFSETGCAYLISGLTLFLLAAWLGKRKGQEWARKSLATIMVALLALVAALAVLVASPSNVRYGEMAANPAPPLMVPVLALEYAFNFIVDSSKSLPIPHVVFVVFFAALSVLSATIAPRKSPLDFKRAGLLLLLTAVVVFLLIAAIQAPTAYFYSAPPDPRGQSLSRFTMLTGLALGAWAVGQAIAGQWAKKWVALLAMLLLILGYVYTARCVAITYAELPGFIQRAQLWDERDAFIQTARAEGNMLVEVRAIDTCQIGTKDIVRSKATDKWVSNCAAGYYGLQAIRIIPP